MKKLAFAVVVLVGSVAFAQEIGTEITPVTPGSGVQQPNENPYAQPNQGQQQQQPKQGDQKQGTGYTYKPRGQGSKAEPTFEGPKVSAAGGDFGIRAGFGASGATSVPTGTGATGGVAAPTVGIAFMGTDNVKLLADIGFGMAVVGSNVPFALGVTVGIDYLARNPGDALRPLFHFGASFNLASAGSTVGIGFGAQVGGGAEYFFSPHFSVNGRLLISVPMSVANDNFILGIFTLTPGVGATWYF